MDPLLHGSNDQQGHLSVLDGAYLVYIEKDAQRGDMWRQFPVEDKIRELRERVTRLEALSDRSEIKIETKHQLMIDEGVDIINYAVFMIRQLQEGIPSA